MAKRRFTREFKLSAVKLVNEQGYSLTEAAKSLGIDPANVRDWVRKFSVPEAQLYTSQLVTARRAYAEATGKPWYILFAKHGLVHPDQLIPPYDLEISDLDDQQHAALAFAVAKKLRAWS